MGILLFILAVFPGLFLSWYIWWRDKHEREPHKYLIACFVFGLLSVFPALLLEETHLLRYISRAERSAAARTAG